MEDIKITMLGASGAGKTCFMLAMYGVMQGGVNCFTFSTQDPDQGLDLDQRWQQMLEGVGSDRFPAPTNQTTKFSFNLDYAYKKLVGFEWLDYRGGAIVDKAQGSDLMQLREQLVRSHGICICLSGEDFSQNRQKSLWDVRRKNNVNRVNQLLSEVRSTNPTQTPAVCLVLTKYDLCHQVPREELMGQIREIFNPLFAPGSGWLVAICPVTLGQGLANSETPVCPEWVHLPVSFAIATFFRRMLGQLQQKLEGEEKTVDCLREKERGLRGNFFKDFWNSKKIDNLIDQVAKHDRTRADTLMDLQRYRNDIGKLEQQLLSEIPVYDGG